MSPRGSIISDTLHHMTSVPSYFHCNFNDCIPGEWEGHINVSVANLAAITIPLVQIMTVTETIK